MTFLGGVINACLFTLGLLLWPLITGDWDLTAAQPYIYGGFGYFLGWVLSWLYRERA